MLQNHKALAGALVVLAAAACFGTLGPVSRLAYRAGMTPIGFVAWRALLGGLVLLALVAWRSRRGTAFASLGGLPRAQQANLALAAFSGFVLNLAIFVAFARLSVALALLAFYTYPAMVAVVATVIHGERLDRPKLTALGLALAGMGLVVAGQIDPSGAIALDLLGLVLAFVAAASQTVYVTIGRHGYVAVRSEQATSVVLLTDAAGYALTAFVIGAPGNLSFPLSDASVWPILLFAGIAGAGLPSLLFLTGVRWIGGTRTSILALFEPVVGVILAALLLGEALRPIQIVGGILILTAGALLQRAPEPPSRAGPPPEPQVPALV